jgi:hypothetical protein
MSVRDGWPPPISAELLERLREIAKNMKGEASVYRAMIAAAKETGDEG